MQINVVLMGLGLLFYCVALVAAVLVGMANDVGMGRAVTLLRCVMWLFILLGGASVVVGFIMLVGGQNAYL